MCLAHGDSRRHSPSLGDIGCDIVNDGSQPVHNWRPYESYFGSATLTGVSAVACRSLEAKEAREC